MKHLRKIDCVSMSALPPIADIQCRERHVCFVPVADITGRLIERSDANADSNSALTLLSQFGGVCGDGVCPGTDCLAECIRG